MDSVKDILKNFKPTEDKYLSREFQSFGVHIAEKLGDIRHKSLYIKLARDIPRPVLQKALQFVVDSNAKRKGALFMWKLKELGAWHSAGKDGAKSKGGKSGQEIATEKKK